MKTKHLLHVAGGLLMSAFGHGLFAQTYCTPTPAPNCGLDDEIRNVTFAGINNNSGCTSGYGNYTSGTAANVMAGLSYPISVNVGPGGNEAIAAWIDYNQNGTFETSEYTYIGNVASGTATASIAIPASASAGATRMRIRSFYVTSSGNPATIYTTTADPSCASISTNFGETEDYTVNISSAVNCSGVPATLTATASVANTCGEGFNLSASNTMEAGLSYQWQSSTDGGTTWTNLGAAQVSAGYSVTGQTQTTQYRLVLTCSNGGASVTSNAVTVTQNPLSACFCQPVLDCTDNDVITNVTIGTINNNSTCGTDGYSDYTALAPASIQALVSTPISVTVGDGWTSESVSVWIDYNHNGVFEASEFTYIGTGSSSVVTGSITVPASAMTGNARMRVRVAAVGAVAATDDLACDEEQEYGESEDYMVNITAATACTGVPATLTVSSTETAVCANVAYTLSADNTAQNGLSYQWQSSTDGGTTWTNLGAAQTSDDYAVSTQSQTTQYRLVLTCSNGGASVTSNVVTVTQNPLSACYCVPMLDCSENDAITNVTFGTINNNSTCGTDGYSDYTTMTANVQTSQSYPISVTVGDGWTNESVSVWIDYNHDGSFDAAEFTYVGTGSGSVVSGSIAIPPTAMNGTTRMRVRVAAVGAAGATDDMACDEEDVYGETEDYTVNITTASTTQVDSVVVTTQGNVPAVIATPTGTLQVVATVYPSTVNQAVTWSIINVSGTATISASGLVTAQAAGTVWAKAVSVENTAKKDSILITINPLVGVDSVVVKTQGNVAPAITTNAGSLQLVATVYPSSQNQSVIWNIMPGGTGTAAISTTGLVVAQTNGTVWARATSVANNAKWDTLVITITNQGLGMDELFAGDNLSVFPNPTSGDVKVVSAKAHGALTVRLTDAIGNVLTTFDVKDNGLNDGVDLNLSNFAPGMYFITLEGEGTAITRSVIRRQ